MEKLNRETAKELTDLYNKLDSLEHAQRLVKEFSGHNVWLSVKLPGRRNELDITRYCNTEEIAAIALTNIEAEIKKVKESLTALGAKI